jgi:SAM-dependent methyltransferase
MGFEFKYLAANLRTLPDFGRSLQKYQKENRRPNFSIAMRDLYPVLHEVELEAGGIGGHYFHQDLWAARKVFEGHPDRHIDVGSRIDGFVAHLLVFMPVTMVDIRPVSATIPGLTFVQSDATTLETFEDNSVPSISSLHAAEHFGLGRYGDAIEPDACFRFMSSLCRVLAPGGRLYFSVPIGRERVEFNAHRVFAVDTILDSFSELTLCSFSFVDDNGCLHENVKPVDMPSCDFSCGLFEFTKVDLSRERP